MAVIGELGVTVSVIVVRIQSIHLKSNLQSDMAAKQCLDNGDWFSRVEGNPFREWTDYR